MNRNYRRWWIEVQGRKYKEGLTRVQAIGVFKDLEHEVLDVKIHYEVGRSTI